MEPTLTQREFDTWREGDTDFKQQMLAHMASQTEINREFERRVTTVETKQEECAQSVTRRSAWISGIVAALLGGLAGTWTGWK
jgi:hypothetical protein